MTNTNPQAKPKKPKVIADLSVLLTEPIGAIKWFDGQIHNVLDPVDLDWPDHLRLLHVGDELDAAIDTVPQDLTPAEELRDEMIATVQSLKMLLAPMIPTVTPEQWETCGAKGTFAIASAVRDALREKAGVNVDPMRTSQPTTTTKAAQ
jgi:hypothetical protein